MKLTRNEKNERIARACGWQMSAHGWWSHDTLPDNGGAMDEPPDYFNDLNACHEAWKKLVKGNEELEDKYSIELLRAIGSDDPSDGTRPNGSDATWALASNAPSQSRFEALGITLNLWTSEE